MQANDAVTTALTGELPAVLIAASLLAFPISLTILWLYRRAVVRGMRAAGVSAGTRPAVAPVRTASPPIARLRRVSAENEASDTLPAPAAALYARIRRSPWRTAGVYTAAGGAYALIHAIANSLIADGQLLPLRLVLLWWVYLWPAVIAVGLIAAVAARPRLGIVAVYLLALVGLGAVGAALSPGLSPFDFLLVWLITDVPPTLLLLVFLNRRVRAIGPLVLAFMMLGLMGSSRLVTAIGANDDRLGAIVSLGQTLELGPYQILAAMIVTGFAALAIAAWVLLRWIRGRYERKRISDESLMLDAVWLLFTVVHSVTLAFEHVAWLATGAAAFLAYKAVAAAGFWWLRRRGGARAVEVTSGMQGHEHPRLLVLRVFALGRRGQRLFDGVTRRWRHAGSIYMIAGPDLATTAIEPHELLDFATGRLARRFIDGPAMLERRLAEADDAEDRDGRFRVNEFFCRDDAWRDALSRLASRTEAVVMDLRSFSRGNAGCVYEIKELVDIVPLERVVLVIDETTDRAFLDETLDAAWADARADSPNRSSGGPAVRIVSLGERGGSGATDVLRSLCRAAAAPAAIPAPL